jgi:hypothetical protein
VDVSSFLQTDELYKMAGEVNERPAVNFEELLKVPCHHPCSPPVPEPTPQSFGASSAVGSLSKLEPSAPRPTVTFLAPAVLTAPAVAAPPYRLVDDRVTPALEEK